MKPPPCRAPPPQLLAPLAAIVGGKKAHHQAGPPRPPRPPAPDRRPPFPPIAGDKSPTPDAAALEPHLVEGRGLYHGRSAMLLRPGSVDEVVAILKLANQTKTPLGPPGGNTGLVGAQIPFDGELILSLTRLDKIREVDAASNSMTCEAGVVLANAQAAAAAADRLFPLSPGAA